MTRKEIAAAMKKLPGLNDFGVGLYDGLCGATKEEKEAWLLKMQNSLLGSSKICAAVCDWLASKRRTKTINRRRTSYGIKHACERDIDNYVSNGCLIACAIHCGFAFRRDGDGPNVCFNIAEAQFRQPRLPSDG